MIEAWRTFRVTVDGHLRSLFIDYTFEGPISRTEKPFVSEWWDEVEADPVGAVQRHGEEWVLEVVRSWPGLWNSIAFPDQPRPTGFHAYKDRKEAEKEHMGAPFVFARVSLFGRVVEHERGYRAEALRVDALEIPEHLSHLKEALETRYACEVTCLTSEENLKSTKSIPQRSRSRYNAPQAFLKIPPGQILTLDDPFPIAKKSWFQRAKETSANWFWREVDRYPPGSLGDLIVLVLGGAAIWVWAWVVSYAFA